MAAPSTSWSHDSPYMKQGVREGDPGLRAGAWEEGSSSSGWMGLQRRTSQWATGVSGDLVRNGKLRDRGKDRVAHQAFSGEAAEDKQGQSWEPDGFPDEERERLTRGTRGTQRTQKSACTDACPL